MKALYDISWLGLTYQDGQTRSGLGRAIESTAEALLKVDDCDVCLCAANSAEAFRGAAEYLRNGSPLPTEQFGGASWFAQKKVSAATLVDRTADRINPMRGTRMLRRISRRVLKMGRRDRELIRPQDLDGAQVYQAQYLEVPEWLRAIKRLRRFSTVYDLIPLKFPELCPEATTASLKAIMQSIQVRDHAICISHFTKNDLCEYRKDLDPDRVSVAHLGASVAFHPCRDKEEIQRVRTRYGIGEGSYLLSVSTVAPHKNFARLIESFGAMVHEQGIRDLSLVITGGSGWKRERIMEALARWNIAESRIILTGYAAEEDLPALYGGALAFVFPSLYEGFGLPVLEAMQCGTPVISSNSSSLPEVGGDAALFFEPLDSDALSAAMLTLYRDEATRKELAEKSLIQARKFSWERCARDTVAAYRKALTN